MKTKEWRVWAVKETDLVGTVRVPADWTYEQVWEWLREGNTNPFAWEMFDAGGGDWRWCDVQEPEEHEPYVYDVESDEWIHEDDEEEAA